MGLELKILTPDPLNILTSTREVVIQAKQATLSDFHQHAIEILIPIIKPKLQRVSQTPDVTRFKGLIDTQKAQRVFLESAVNFSFWAKSKWHKWRTDREGELLDGGFGMMACFDRALAEGVPILDADYLAELNPQQTEALFQSSNRNQIPLLQARRSNLQEAAQVLTQKYQGQFINLVEAAGFDAVEIVKRLATNFPSFRDGADYHGLEVSFLKRAQLCAYDTSVVLGPDKITNLEALTAFADYKLPQVLRSKGVLAYSVRLSDWIEQQKEIFPGKDEEIEIRAATVWGVELIRQALADKKEKYSAAQIDNALWLMGQDLPKDIQPYHRTRTIYY